MLLRAFAILPACILAPPLCFCVALVQSAARGRLFARPEVTPINEAGVVLGTAKISATGRPNQHFANRIAAAAALWRAGRVHRLIVSGNNDGNGYDEPADMRDALVSLGVPAAAITLDGAGYRTLESVIRAREVFGLSRVTFITERFHAYRALFLARHQGLDAVAFVCGDVPFRVSYKTRLREIVADARACVDVCVRRFLT